MKYSGGEIDFTLFSFRVGVFRLTEPDGMQTVMSCNLKGFHQHPEDVTIYVDANIFWKTEPFNTVDMRT